MIALIGLGNPGTKHKNNRHNVGYLFIDQLLQDHDDVMREKKFDGELASVSYTHLTLPTSVMV